MLLVSLEVFYKKVFLKNSQNSESWGLQLYLKRGSGIGIFLRILQIF